MLQIADIRAAHGLLLAPMEDVTELPFRLICRELGADIVYTEFVNAEGLLREDADGPRRTFRKLRFLEEERPLGIQLYGATSLSMERAAEIATEQNPDLIDINCGCWVSNVALRGAGAGLLRDLPQMKEVVRRVISATHLPVTVKTRLGWDGDSIQIVDVARMLEDLGVRALSLHCRTRSQGHKGAVDYSWIARVKEAVSMPVVLNGDVVTPQNVRDAFDTTGCDGVMIGRGAISHPWIFRDAKHYLKTGEQPPPVPLEERWELILRHASMLIEWGKFSAEKFAMQSLRSRLMAYSKGLPAGKTLRTRFSTVNSLCELEDIAEEYLSRSLSAEPAMVSSASPIS